MKIGIAKETISGEKRVALTPESVKKLKGLGNEIYFQSGAGIGANYSDKEYADAGASDINSFEKLAETVDVLLKIRPPSEKETLSLKNNSILISFQDPMDNAANIQKFAEKKITAFAVEFIPRITLAQSMDVLSSMATIAGYRAVLEAAHHFGRFMPMFMTAAGTIPPARALILGAGVAGLQAIATAKRLGAIVEVFDVRPAAKEQVESLGGKFIEMELDHSAQDSQGYAKEMTAEFIKKEMELIETHLSKADICVTTAQVFGKKAPVLIKDYMIPKMKAGSVIVDIAVEQGGNCELSKPGEIVEVNGVKIVGPLNLVSSMAEHASKMYSKNMENLLLYLIKEGKINPDASDEITTRTLLTRSGEMVSEIVKKARG